MDLSLIHTGPEAKAAVAAQQFCLIETDEVAYAAIFLASDESV